MLFSLRTMVRNTNWFTPYTLLRHDIQVNQDSFDIENNYSGELLKLNRHDEALLHAKKSIQLNPKYAPAWASTGNVYMQKKDYKTAISHYSKSLEIDGGYYFAFYNMIYAHLLQEEYTSAKGWSETALKSFPNQPELILFLASAEYKLGNISKALELAKRSYELQPNPQSQNIYSIIRNNQQLNIE